MVLAAAAPAAAGDDNTRTAPSSQQLAFAAAPITRDPIRNEALYYVKLNPEMRLEDATQLIAKTASEWAAKAAHVEQQPFSSVLELMTPVDDLVTLRADEPLSAAVTRFLETGVNLLPVLGPEGTVRAPAADADARRCDEPHYYWAPAALSVLHPPAASAAGRRWAAAACCCSLLPCLPRRRRRRCPPTIHRRD